MRAAVLEECGKPLVIEEMTPIPLGEHEVRVRIEASGVCQSDLMVQGGGSPLPAPLIMGHEGAGVVTEVGSSVSRVKPGNRVICSWWPQCGECFFCVNGQPFICERSSMLASPHNCHAVRSDGGQIYAMLSLGTFADILTVEETQLVPIDTDLPMERLALIGCSVATGVLAALNTAEVVPGSTVAVIGCGGVGLSIVQGARVAGAAKIFAVDPVSAKRDTALKLGATDPIDPGDGDTVEQLRAATEGRGPDYVFEALGRAETYMEAYQATRLGGTAVFVGSTTARSASLSFSTAELHRPKRVMGCQYGSANIRRDFPKLVRLVEAGRLDLESLITHSRPLDEVNDALAALARGEAIRTVLVP